MINVLLDEHVSGPVIGSALMADGLDVRCADVDELLKHAADVTLFAVAVAERRVLVTNNTKDFAPMVRDLADLGEDHFGVIFVPHSIHARDLGHIIRQLRTLFAGCTQEDWINRVEWTHRRST